MGGRKGGQEGSRPGRWHGSLFNSEAGAVTEDSARRRQHSFAGDIDRTGEYGCETTGSSTALLPFDLLQRPSIRAPTYPSCVTGLSGRWSRTRHRVSSRSRQTLQSRRPRNPGISQRRRGVARSERGRRERGRRERGRRQGRRQGRIREHLRGRDGYKESHQNPEEGVDASDPAHRSRDLEGRQQYH